MVTNDLSFYYQRITLKHKNLYIFVLYILYTRFQKYFYIRKKIFFELFVVFEWFLMLINLRIKFL